MKVKAFFRKHFWIALILLVLACVAVTGFVSRRTDGFDDMSGLTNVLNAANLLEQGKDGNYLVDAGKAIRQENGLIVTFADNGSVKVRGDIKNESSTYTCAIARLTLQPGTYTLTSGMFGASNSTHTKNVWISVNNASTGNLICNGDFGGVDTNGTFTVDAETQVEVVLNVYPGDWSDARTLYPVLVKGSEAGGFYA